MKINTKKRNACLTGKHGAKGNVTLYGQYVIIAMNLLTLRSKTTAGGRNDPAGKQKRSG